MNKIIVEIGYTGNNYGAYLPILQGVVSTGGSLEETQRNIKEAVEFHLDGMREDREIIPTEFEEKYEYKYHLTTETLLHAYNGVFTKSTASRHFREIVVCIRMRIHIYMNCFLPVSIRCTYITKPSELHQLDISSREFRNLYNLP